MKRGGVGYVQPSPEAFPTVAEFHAMIVACGALPCVTWLDGTTAGEQAIDELLDLLIGQGAVAMNIIPDRNWNIADPETRQLKVAKLHEIVRIAAARDLPINVGTEMNAPGNKLVDDFDVPEMAPVKQAFLDGAHFIYGHTVMQRALGLGYQSEWAQAHLPTRRERNDFYTTVGYRVPPGADGLARLRALSPFARAAICSRGCETACYARFRRRCCRVTQPARPDRPPAMSSRVLASGDSVGDLGSSSECSRNCAARRSRIPVRECLRWSPRSCSLPSMHSVRPTKLTPHGPD